MPLPEAMPNTIFALQAAMRYLQTAWVEAASSAPLSPGERDAYIRGLAQPGSLIYPADGDPLKARVANVAPEAPRLERGFASYHLPSRMRWALARGAKRSRHGGWYMAIPFRHVAPHSGRVQSGAVQARQMTWPVYRAARRLQRGESLTHAPGLRQYVPRLPQNLRPGYVHLPREVGMQRLPRRGGAQYLSFRTITSQSTGWWIPGKPGAHLLVQVKNATAPQIQAMLAEGVRRDMAEMVRSMGGES